jgi:hypothetical protein
MSEEQFERLFNECRLAANREKLMSLGLAHFVCFNFTKVSLLIRRLLMRSGLTPHASV